MRLSIAHLGQTIVGLALLTTLPLRADTIWIGSGEGAGIAAGNVKIERIEGGKIYYEFAGSKTSRELSLVKRMQIDSEPALNTAEEAYAGDKLDAAVDGYQRTLRSTTKLWLKDWAAVRLLDSATKSNRFDAAVSAYVHLLQSNPELAKQSRPALPDAKSSYLDTAVNEVNAVLGARGITDDQKLTLLGFLIDIHRVRGDKAAEDKAALQMDELLAKDPNNPAAGAAIARRKIQGAQKLLDAKDFAKAIAEIEASKPSITDPAQQAEAMFIIAQARSGLAEASKKPEDLKDAALAYMRVVAHFKDLPGRPRVVESLIKTAAIHETLGEMETARQIYQQIVQQFPDDPNTPAAKAALDKLKR